jgi:hypothetical protein
MRIAQQISHVFGVDLDKDVVRRVRAKHYRPAPGADGVMSKNSADFCGRL